MSPSLLRLPVLGNIMENDGTKGAVFCGLHQFFQPVTAPEQFDVEQKFLPGVDPQFLVDVGIVPADCVDADAGLFGHLADPLAVGIIFQNIVFGRGKGSRPPGERGKKLFDVGGKLRTAGGLHFGLYIIKQFINFRHMG